jgi:uncharacterized protein (TIGR02099 family)
LENSIFHRLSSLLWGLIVTLTVLFAIYVSLGRLLASNLGHYSEAILAEFNRRVPFTVEAERVTGEWHSFSPRIVLSGLRLKMPGMEHRPLELDRGRIGLDVLDSLRTGSLQATRLELYGLKLYGEVDPQGRFGLSGFTAGGEAGRWLEQFLLNIERLTLTRNVLELALPSGAVHLLDLELDLSRTGSRRFLDATLHSTRGAAIQALGEGLGNPLQPDRFRGQLYLDITTDDLAAMPAMFAREIPPLWADGAANIELWINWDRGEAEVESRLRADDLRLLPREGEWEIPLQRVTLEAQLLEQKKRRTLFISGLELAAAGQSLTLPRLQADFWGNALRLRARDVDLAPLNALVTGIDLMPGRLAEVFRTLSPRGALDRVQLYLGDIASPGIDWELEANFSAVEVDSWQGAPGVASADGYAELAEGSGFVLLDGSDLAMSFPTVYREPLRYDSFSGAFDIDWDTAGLQLSSGLVTASAEEGAARALFGLSVPFGPSDPGIEMDLMVGMEDTRSSYRARYLPYILDPGLLEWLSTSVGEGEVERAGFVWRGSLQSDADALRTVQLGLTVADLRLDYDPGWPAVEDIDGVLLIDDTDVSFWSENGRLYDSSLEHLSAEGWMDGSGKMMLAIDARLRGPAADGLSVLNNSPLRQTVGDAFADWQVAGGLETELGLLIELGDAAVAPRVNVITRWQDVDLEILPGGLPLRSVNGVLAYSSRDGFRSKGLTGSLWAKPMTVEVGHAPEPPGPGQILPPVEVDMAVEIDLADLRDWLGVDLLRLARGSTALALQVRAAAGQAPQLSARTNLAGVSLDLPPPWRTGAEERRLLAFRMPLGGGQTRVEFTLEGGVDLVLLVRDRALSAGALAFNAAPGDVEPGRFRISGSTPLLDVDAWQRFVDEYLANGLTGDIAAAAPDSRVAGDPNRARSDAESLPGAVATAPDLHQRGTSPPTVAIDELVAERLVVAGQSFDGVTIGLEEQGGQWQLAARTDWFEGELLFGGGSSVPRLVLERLEFDGLGQLDLSASPENEVAELPDLDVAVRDLRSGGSSLGHLDFLLRSEGQELRAEAITGELAGLRIESPQPGRLRWVRTGTSATTLELHLAFDDFGDTLERLDYPRLLETEEGTVDLALEWPGAPRDFALQSAGGSVRLKAGEGSFLEASAGASGALRVVGILDLASIVRRLSLSQLFESGIPFETVTGEFYLHGGNIEVARLDVNGASSRFQFSGVSEIASRSMNGEMVATLPVASNLPWVAALAGGLPVAAGVFVVSKMFEKQFDTLSSAVYRIEGTWDDPEVRFDRIWDAARTTRPLPEAADSADSPPDPDLPDPEGPPDVKGAGRRDQP